MKGRIQILNFETDAELRQHVKQLKDYCMLLKLQAQLVENRHYKNIYFVQLSKSEAISVCECNALDAFCMKNDYVFDLREDDYPSF